MLEYDYRVVGELVSGPRFSEDQSERICPVCKKRAVRTYTYRSNSGRRVTRITYSWCASCRHFKGWTGPDSTDIRFTDPFDNLSQSERRTLERDFDTFFERLDELWEQGIIPQKFSPMHANA